MPPLQTIEFNNLSGVHTQKALTNFNPDESPDCVGGYFNTFGSFIKRKGGQKYNTTAMSGQTTGLYDYHYNNDTSQLFLIYNNGNLKQGNAGSPLDIKTGLTIGAFPDFEVLNDYCHIVNGADGMLKATGTTVTNEGITRPASAPSGSGTTGGTLTDGTYLIRYTYVNDSDPNNFIESNPSDQFSITLSGSTAISLTGVTASSDPQVTKRYVYMTQVGGSLLSFNIAINDNTTTTVTILNPSAGALLAFNHDTPPTGLVGIEQYKGRLFGFNKNFLYFTLPFQPWYWPQGQLDQTYKFTLQLGDSYPILGLKTFYDYLLIFKRNAIYVLYGNDDTDFQAYRLQTDDQVGCVADRTIAIIENWCYFLGPNSVYRTNGTYTQDVGIPINDYFNENTSNTAYQINKNLIQNSCAVFFKNKNLYLLFAPVTGAITTNSMCFAMDTTSVKMDQATGKVTASWNPWPGFTTQAACIVRENGINKWFRGDDQGYVFRQEALDGDGSNITSTSTGSNDSTHLNDTTQSLTVNLYSGLRIDIISGTGIGQTRTISSNTATQFTVSSAWSVTPDATSVYSVGGPYYHYQHAWDAYGNKDLSKRWRYARPRFDTTGNFNVNVTYAFDFSLSSQDQVTVGLASLSLWDVALWNVASWDGNFLTQGLNPLMGNRIHRWSSYIIQNNSSGQPIKYNGMDKIFQAKGLR